MSARQFPSHPDPRQLKHQARDLLRAFRALEPGASAEFRAHHPYPDRTGPANAILANAQLVLARSYGASSWTQLITACRLIHALQHDDLDSVRELVAAHPALTQDRGARDDGGWRTAAAAAASLALRRVVDMLRQRGARDIASVSARPELRPWLDTLRLLGRVGARFPFDAVGGAVELLDGDNFAFMIEIGGAIEDERGDWRSRVALALETYTRHPAGKHRVLETMAAHGIPLPDSPVMALHRGRIDLLEAHLQRDPALLRRTFVHAEIYPPALGCHAEQALALHGAPLDGATLLHIATDFEELEIVRWLLDRGMDVNARARIDATGFGGHTALFSCVVSYNAGRGTDPVAQLLLERGANANARASIRKGLAFARDPSVHEYRAVTPLGWGRRFHDPSYVCQAALRAIAAHGGQE